MPGRNRIHVEPLSRELLGGVLRVSDDAESDPDLAPTRVRLDLGVIPWFRDERPLRGLAGFIDWRRSGALSRLVRSGFCDGEAAESVLLPGGNGLPVDRLVFVGMGSSATFDLESAPPAAERLVGVASGLAPRDVLFSVPDWLPDRLAVEALFSGVVQRLAARAGRVAQAGMDTSSDLAAAADASRQPTPLWSNAPWWMVADARNLSRLRRLLEGPPRAAAES